MTGDLLLLGVRRLRGQPTRFRGPYDTRLLASRAEAIAAVEAALGDQRWVRAGPRTAGFRLTVFDGHTVCSIRSGVDQVRAESAVPDVLRLVWHLPDPAITAAEGLAVLCELIVAADAALTPRDLVVRLGEQAAGITPGRAGWADLLRAGHNRLPGSGFAPAYDDGSLGQVRHFTGTAAASLRLGRATRIASILTGDLPGSADLRLSDQAIAFAHALTAGTLAPRDTAAWIRTHLIASRPA